MFSGVKFPDEGVCRRAFKFYSVTSGCVAADLLRLSYAVAKCRRVPASVAIAFPSLVVRGHAGVCFVPVVAGCSGSEWQADFRLSYAA
ncbi:hypothetical protein [Anaplasma marginale]|uniref:hypothetical protein n=1 Tax=Anaplasma marginale TaxID=770 RepID=UPI0018EA2A6F|nr:hypothetical protein [Anaplasma marginale]